MTEWEQKVKTILWEIETDHNLDSDGTIEERVDRLLYHKIITEDVAAVLKQKSASGFKALLEFAPDLAQNSSTMTTSEFLELGKRIKNLFERE